MGLKGIQIDAVVDNLHRICPHERLLDHLCKPPGWGNNRQIQASKNFSFGLIQPAALIEEPRTGSSLGAAVAHMLPLCASDHIKVGTVPGKSPAVVEGPYQLCLVPAKPRKERFQITVVTMKIMQMHDIRLNPLQLGDHFSGRKL